MSCIVKAFIGVTAGLMALTATAQAASDSTNSQRRDVRFAVEYGSSLPPLGFVDFCRRDPSDCDASEDSPARATISTKSWRSLQLVNVTVNGAIAPVDDETLYGTPEYWTVPTDAGDCEDVALLKKKKLEDAGFPAAALRLTVVLDEQGEGHAVLSVSTTRGDYILDNRRNDIRLWSRTGYTLLKRQSADNPRRWMALAPVKSSPRDGDTASK
jgi:predicted transglutaminase-like cysteine proteinase